MRASERVAVVTGAGGLIGSALVGGAARGAPGWRVVGLTRRELDLTDLAALRRVWQDLRPDLVLHCAALSRPRTCDEQPELARRINLEATACLAELAEAIPFVFFSSDQVFDGLKGWYAETDPVSPVNYYGETKAAAERLVLANPQHIVVRTSLNAGLSAGSQPAFNEEMRAAWAAGRTLTLFTDEYRCPIHASVTARAVWELVQASGAGLFHVAGAERLSRWELGGLLARRWPALDAKTLPGSCLAYAGAARPPDVSLDCAKVQRVLSFPLPKFSEWLAAHPDDPL